jgi:hypothetical protein
VEGNDRQLIVSAGDLVLLPHGNAHVMRDCLSTEPTPLDQIVADHPLEDKYGSG